MMPEGLQDFTAGEVLTAAKMDKLGKQAVVDCTNATKPSLNEGGVIAVTDTDRLEVYDGSAYQRFAHFAAAGRTGCRLRRAATQSINSASSTAISWDTEDADSDGFITATSDTITIPTGFGGIYVANVTVDWAADPSPSRIGFQVSRSSVTMEQFSEVGSTGVPTGDLLGCSMMMPLSAADTIKVIVRQSSGGAINITTAYLDLFRIGL